MLVTHFTRKLEPKFNLLMEGGILSIFLARAYKLQNQDGSVSILTLSCVAMWFAGTFTAAGAFDPITA